MKKLLLIISVLLYTFVGYCQYSIDFGKSINGIDVKRNDNYELVMSFNYAGINKLDVNTQRGGFTQLVLEGSYRTGLVGDPQLPSTKKLIQVPYGAELSVEVVNFNVHDYDLEDYGIYNKLMPYQPSYPKSMDPAVQEFMCHENEYLKDEFTEIELAQVNSVGMMRGVNLAQLTINPVRYNPAKNTIRVYNNIEVKVTFKNADLSKIESLKANAYSPYFESVQNLVVNASSSAKTNFTDNPDHTKYPVKYLIVTDPAFETELADFVAWKTKKGFEVIMVTTDDIGGTAAEIKTWIHAQYNAGTEFDPAPTFFLLVGDTGQIPPSKIGDDSEKATDLYYACVDGANDIIPDMYYGRFSAQNSTQLQNMLDKVLYYEKYEFADPTYLNDITLIAGADGTWNPDAGQPTINYGTDNYFNTEHGFTTVNKYLTSYSGCYDNDRIQVSMINYTAHCSETSWADPALSISAVNAMQNTNKYPLAIGNCCLAADFGTSECIGETWMRKANGGAVAYIGSSPSSYWYEDFYWSVGAHPFSAGNSPTFEGSTIGAYDAPYVTDYLCVDALIFVGNLAVTEAHDQNYSTSITAKYYWEAYNCLSDPSLFIYLTEGDDNSVSHLPTIPIGVTEYEVSAVAGSYVAISKDGVLYGTAIVPESGTVTVSMIPITTGGNADIVVTKSQYKPYMTTVPAAALDGPYLTINDFVIVDASANGEVEIGEGFNVDLTLKNVGTELAQEVTVSMVTNDPYVESISENLAIAFADIAADATGTVADKFIVVVKDSVPDQHKITFSISIADNSIESKKIYEATKTVTVNAPVLKLSEEMILNDSDGNSNGLLDPGETAKLTVNVSNIGHAPINVDALLSFDVKNPYLSFITTTDDLGIIGAGETVSAEFTVEADAITPQGTPVDVLVNVAGGSTPLYLDQNGYQVIIGQVPEVTIGSGTEQASNYPFNNYYENNKTQMLYLASEIGPGSKVITDIAFDIAQATADVSKRDLANFTIVMKLTNATSLSNYVDMADGVTVFSQAPYILTGDLGWETFVLDQGFTYDGTSNLIVEITWGENYGYTSISDRTIVNATTTIGNTVAYGYADDAETPANFGAVSTKRPNLKMHYAENSFMVDFHVTADNSDIQGAEVFFDDVSLFTNAGGIASFNTEPQENLAYAVNYEGYYEANGVLNVDNNITKEIVLEPIADVLFVVSDPEGFKVEGVQVGFNDEIVYTNERGEALFVDVYETINKPYYVSSTEYLAVNNTVDVGDEDLTILLTIYELPEITFIVKDIENIAIEGANVYFDGIIKLTTESGMVVFENVHPAVDKAIEISNSSYLRYFDTIAVDLSNKVFNIKMQDAPEVKFIVTDGVNKLEGVSIAFNELKISTSDIGECLFEDVVTGTYVYAATLAGYYSVTDTIMVGTDNVIENIVMKFIPDVTFIAKHQDSPMENVNVTFGKKSALTDASGQVVFVDVESGDHNYTITAPGYYHINGLCEVVDENMNMPIALAMIPDVVLTVTDGVDVVEGAKVTLNQISKVTNQAGKVEFVDVAAGKYAYTVEKDLYFTIEDSLSVEAVDINETILLSLENYKLTFKVTDGSSPVAEAYVTFNGETKSTNSLGEVIFDGVLVANDYEYTITKVGFENTIGVVDVVDADVTENAQLVLITYSVTFNISDKVEPVQGASVSFNEQTVVTDAQGSAIVTNVVPGVGLAYTIIKSDTHNELKGTVDVDANEVVNVSLALVGVSDGLDDLISMYPNPTSGIVNINLNGQAGNWKIQVLDESGKLIIDVDNANQLNQIDLSNEAKGVYFINVIRGEQMFTKKIILE